MPDTATLMVFAFSALALLVIPGPAVIYISTRSIDQGRLPGLVSVAGVMTGTTLHVLAATLGLSALLASSAVLFSSVKLLGAAYLIYLGVQKLRTSTHSDEQANKKIEPLKQVYRDGVIVNLLNPKLAIFFFAYLPQFANATTGPFMLQILLLGIIYVMLGLLVYMVYALLTAKVGGWLRTSGFFAWSKRYLAGTVFIALGLTTAFSGSRSK